MTTALIAEDEPLLAQALRAELERLWPQLQVVAVARNGVQALAAIQQHRPDLAFLDIRMPGLTGIEVAQTIAEDWDADQPPPLLVFVTAYDEFAVSAFEQAAVDYLLKPVQPLRLAAALERVRRRLREREQSAGNTATGEPQDAGAVSIDALAAQLRQLLNATAPAAAGEAGSGAAAGRLRAIRAAVGDTVRMIPLDQVVLMQAADKYVSIYTIDSESLIREPLKELLPQLDPAQFAQIHRSTVVNLDHVEAAVRDAQGKMSLKLRGRPEKPAVSRLYVHLFKAM